MQYFIISLIAGSCLLALLLIVFFTAGRKNNKQKAADLQLVMDCGDESLLRLYQQADSDNERDGIVEFIKEKLTCGEQDATVSPVDLAPAGEETAPEAIRRSIPGVSSIVENNSAPASSEQATVSGNTAYGRHGETHMLALETIDWQAIELELQQRREEEARIMAQNQQIQEVFSKIREVEERLAGDNQDENEQ